MSRRNKSTGERLIMAGVSKEEYRLRNYLHLNDIQKGKSDMAGLIINSFFLINGGANHLQWSAKVKWVYSNFGMFCQYAQNNWK